MAKGDEPLRSFGDLMQFFKKAPPEPTVKPNTSTATNPVESATEALQVATPQIAVPLIEKQESSAPVSQIPATVAPVKELASVNEGVAPEP